MNEIKNVTDQIELYSFEVADIIRSVRKEYNLTWEEARQVVEMGINDMKVEVLHHELEKLEYISDSLSEIARAIDNKN